MTEEGDLSASGGEGPGLEELDAVEGESLIGTEEESEADSEDDFSCLHEKFITTTQKKSVLAAEGLFCVLHLLAEPP